MTTRRRSLAEKDATCLAKYGCTYAERREIVAVSNVMRAAGAAKHEVPMAAFTQQRSNAGVRGIGWELTFWQWWTIWQESGHWAERGRGNGHYAMCRRGDAGPYAVGNVFIALCTENTSQAKGRIRDLPIGVRRHYSRFRASRVIDGKETHLGLFASPEEAHAAYLAAFPIRLAAVISR